MPVQYSQSLRAILFDTLKVRRVLSRDEVRKIASDNGYLESNAERRLRDDGDGLHVFVQKLNSAKKPVKEKGEKIYFYKWLGRKNIYKKYEHKNISRR